MSLGRVDLLRFCRQRREDPEVVTRENGEAGVGGKVKGLIT